MDRELLESKVSFVKEISDVIVTHQPNVKSIEYEIFENPQYDFAQEFLVINYVGNAKTVRNSNGNSKSAILSDISKYLDYGYYGELEFYDQVASNSELIKWGK